MIKKITNLFAVAFLVVFFAGCSTNMPLKDRSSKVDLSKQSLLVGKLHVKNAYKIKHQPDLHLVVLTQNGKSESFQKPFLIKDSGNEGKEYFYSMPAKPGEATITSMGFLSTAFLINGVGFLSVDQTIQVPESKVVYLGNLDATIVERTNNDQPRAGGVLPLIDQAVTGYAGGTFSTEITNELENDINTLKKQFPAFADAEIVPVLLQDPDEFNLAKKTKQSTVK